MYVITCKNTILDYLILLNNFLSNILNNQKYILGYLEHS